jgi:hypothetical protein
LILKDTVIKKNSHLLEPKTQVIALNI